MVTDLTGMPMSNASLLDEGTAAAEAMAMCISLTRGKKPAFIISSKVHPQSIDVCRTRAEPLGVTVEVTDEDKIDLSRKDVCGVLLQYPDTEGAIKDYSAYIKTAHDSGIRVRCLTRLLHPFSLV
jgi:glycine dehydrogenase